MKKSYEQIVDGKLYKVEVFSYYSSYVVKGFINNTETREVEYNSLSVAIDAYNEMIQALKKIK